jgi:hypothetical protein
LSLLAVLAVCWLWTAESLHRHADGGEHPDCLACQVFHHGGATVVAPVGVSWLSPHDRNASLDERSRSAQSPRGPPSFSLI